METEFYKELKNLINRHSMENDSNTPDWILAKYLENCLKNFNEIINDRERWYGRLPETNDYHFDTQLTIPYYYGDNDKTIMISNNQIPSEELNAFLGYDTGVLSRIGNDSTLIGRPAANHGSNFSVETQFLIKRLNDISDNILKHIEILKKK